MAEVGAAAGAMEAGGVQDGAMVDMAAVGVPAGVMEVDGVILAGVATAEAGAMVVVGVMAATAMVWVAWR